MPALHMSMTATVTGWSFVFYPQTPHPSGYSSSSGPSRMSSTSLMTCSLSWMTSVWKSLKMLSGKKWQGKSLLPTAMGEKCPHWQYPWALLSARWNTKLLQLRVLMWAAFSSCLLLLLLALGVGDLELKRRWKTVSSAGALCDHSVLAQPLSWGAAPPVKGCCCTIVPIPSKTPKVIWEPHPSGSTQAWFVTLPFTPKSTLPQWHILFQKSHSIFKFCSHPSSIDKAGLLSQFLRHPRKHLLTTLQPISLHFVQPLALRSLT